MICSIHIFGEVSQIHVCFRRPIRIRKHHNIFSYINDQNGKKLQYNEGDQF